MNKLLTFLIAFGYVIGGVNAQFNFRVIRNDSHCVEVVDSGFRDEGSNGTYSRKIYSPRGFYLNNGVFTIYNKNMIQVYHAVMVNGRVLSEINFNDSGIITSETLFLNDSTQIFRTYEMGRLLVEITDDNAHNSASTTEWHSNRIKKSETNYKDSTIISMNWDEKGDFVEGWINIYDRSTYSLYPNEKPILVKKIQLDSQAKPISEWIINSPLEDE